MGYAQVQRVVKACGNFRINIDHQCGIHALGADDHVMEIARLKDVDVFLKLGDHECQQVAGLVSREILAQLLHALLLVLALND